LDWNKRAPTPYILNSFSSREEALKEYNKRLENPFVADRVSGRHFRGNVRVAVVAGLETLGRKEVYLTSLAELYL
jgi:hypothetical protein